MTENTITSITPIDGRYQSKTKEFRPVFSEFALIKFRVHVELAWLEFLGDCPQIDDVKTFSLETKKQLRDIVVQFDEQDALAVKAHENRINHDVKAVEYFIKDKCAGIDDIKVYMEYIHFACTSEDINNLAYALMLRESNRVCFGVMDQLIHSIRDVAHQSAEAAMLSRTHGQPASPTTMGKELANFVYRLGRQLEQIRDVKILGKINGAVGNYNAHYVTYPNADWETLARQFVEERLDLDFNPYTTQIEPHDYMAELFDGYKRFNTVLLDFCRDVWSYISLNYFKQKTLSQEVGSSTMPHKVNPIDFENAEGNLGIANALFQHFSEKLPVSRWQRDLSDSTVLRNVGVAVSHSLLAYKSCLRGIAKLQLNTNALNADLDNNWEVVAEALQTVMRRYGIEKPYEKLKDLTRGHKVGRKELQAFIDALELPQDVKHALREITPSNYLGIASKLARQV